MDEAKTVPLPPYDDVSDCLRCVVCLRFCQPLGAAAVHGRVSLHQALGMIIYRNLTHITALLHCYHTVVGLSGCFTCVKFDIVYLFPCSSDFLCLVCHIYTHLVFFLLFQFAKCCQLVLTQLQLDWCREG